MSVTPNTKRFNGKTSFNGRLNFTHIGPGGGSEYAETHVTYPTAETRLADGTQKYCGFRTGVQNIQMIRLATQALAATWDGNGDEAQKIIARNYANNLDGSTLIGGARALNLQARNSGTNLSWVRTLELNARNDSGKNVTELLGAHIRIENYGNVATDAVGMDIEFSDESSNVDPHTKTCLLIRNTDASGMGAVDDVIQISHTSTNGFTNFLHFGAATGDTYTGKTTAVAALGTTLGYVKVSIAGTAGRIAIFNEWS